MAVNKNTIKPKPLYRPCLNISMAKILIAAVKDYSVLLCTTNNIEIYVAAVKKEIQIFY